MRSLETLKQFIRSFCKLGKCITVSHCNGIDPLVINGPISYNIVSSVLILLKVRNFQKICVTLCEYAPEEPSTLLVDAETAMA